MDKDQILNVIKQSIFDQFLSQDYEDIYKEINENHIRILSKNQKQKLLDWHNNLGRNDIELRKEKIKGGQFERIVSIQNIHDPEIYLILLHSINSLKMEYTVNETTHKETVSFVDRNDIFKAILGDFLPSKNEKSRKINF